MPDRSRARQLWAEFSARGDPAGWFEQLYQEDASGRSDIPWDDRKANPHLAAWRAEFAPKVSGKCALVVGCGLGEDAQQVAAWGFDVTAFDISRTAIAMAKKRFPETQVCFLAADLFHAPSEWRHQFDFVFEANTLQALPRSERAQAMACIAEFVKPGGNLLVIARARNESEPEGELPWPLTRRELSKFDESGLARTCFAEITDQDAPYTRRFLSIYTRQ